MGETYGQLGGLALCHPNVGMDCYRLVTIYGETIGARNPDGALYGKPTPIRDNGFSSPAVAAAFEYVLEKYAEVFEALRDL